MLLIAATWKDALYFLRKAESAVLSAAKGGAVQRQLIRAKVLGGTEKADSV